MQQPASVSNRADQAVKPTRLLSLDFFRGVTVAAMTLVNNPGDWGHIYAPLEHAHWHGWTPTDLIFPFFLFIVGVSISFAINKERAQNGLTGKIIRRSLVLFGLGLALNLFPHFDFSTVRIPGVLQRTALVYGAASLIYLRTSTRTQGWLIAGLLIGYWLIMTFIPVPGVGYANLEPETNLGAWIDRMVLGKHLWQSSKVWDPEGLLGTLPAIATGLTGIVAGSLLRSPDRNPAEKVAWLFTAGCLALLGAYIGNGFFPINKSLWTSSFVLLTAGLALQGLSLCYWLIDVQGYRKGTTLFVAFGVNAITIYVLSGLIPGLLDWLRIPQANGTDVGVQQWLYETFFVPYFDSPYNASLAGGLTYVLIWAGISYWMYAKKVIIKV